MQHLRCKGRNERGVKQGFWGCGGSECVITLGIPEDDWRANGGDYTRKTLQETCLRTPARGFTTAYEQQRRAGDVM